MNQPNIPLSFEEAKSFLLALVLTQARIVAMFIAPPFAQATLLPGPLRIAVAFGLGLLVAPIVSPGLHSGAPGGVELLALLIKEAAIGFVLGYLVAIPFWAFETLGFIIDNQRGASIAATIDPATGHDSSPLGILFAQAFLVLFFVTNGVTLFMGLIYDSFLQWPPLAFWPTLTEDAATLLFEQFNRLITIGLLLAAPVLVAMFISEVGLALIGRFVPQLEVFFLAMPIKSALAFLVLVLCSSTLFDYGTHYLQEIGTWVLRLDSLLRPGQ